MEFSGQDLYELWLEAMREQGVECDPWDLLDDTDVQAWNATAQQLQPRE